jgi:hypothetical protein
VAVRHHSEDAAEADGGPEAGDDGYGGAHAGQQGQDGGADRRNQRRHSIADFYYCYLTI